MAIRAPAFAGLFYPGEPRVCRAEIEAMAVGLPVPVSARGGIVPHAGWRYSGRIALRTWQAITAAKPEAVIILGAVHREESVVALLDTSQGWSTPLGVLPMDQDILSALRKSDLFMVRPESHAQEHAIEVQLPLLQHLLPEVMFVPVGVPLGAQVVAIGEWCAEVVRQSGRQIALVASTDLTHYGPNYRFQPAGQGPAGSQWAYEVNDRRFLGAVERLAADRVVVEAETHHNACGAGAVAALVAAANVLGWGRFELLEHATSASVTGRASENVVGYAAGVFRGD